MRQGHVIVLIPAPRPAVPYFAVVSKLCVLPFTSGSVEVPFRAIFPFSIPVLVEPLGNVDRWHR